MVTSCHTLPVWTGSAPAPVDGVTSSIMVRAGTAAEWTFWVGTPELRFRGCVAPGGSEVPSRSLNLLACLLTFFVNPARGPSPEYHSLLDASSGPPASIKYMAGSTEAISDQITVSGIFHFHSSFPPLSTDLLLTA
jgi:hypothetical protein